MAQWLKILLTLVTGFSAGAGAASQLPQADTTSVLAVGGTSALSALVALFVKPPAKPG